MHAIHVFQETKINVWSLTRKTLRTSGVRKPSSNVVLRTKRKKKNKSKTCCSSHRQQSLLLRLLRKFLKRRLDSRHTLRETLYGPVASRTVALCASPVTSMMPKDSELQTISVMKQISSRRRRQLTLRKVLYKRRQIHSRKCACSWKSKTCKPSARMRMKRRRERRKEAQRRTQPAGLTREVTQVRM